MRGTGGIIVLAAWGAVSSAGSAWAATPAQEPVTAYLVRRGDTLYGLGQLYLARPSDYGIVQRLNEVRNPRRLPIGRTLDIPDRLLRTEPVVGSLVAFRGAVTISGPGGTMQPRLRLPLPEGSQLATGANAFLTFELPDGSRVTLPSQSRIRIARLRSVVLTGAVIREFEVGAGRSRSVVTPAERPADRFVVRTPLTVAAVRGTEFRVRHDPGEERSSVEVIEGRVASAAAAAPGAETVIGAGFGAHTDRTGASPPRPLLPAPKVGSEDLLQDEPALRFRVAGPDGAVRHRAQIAMDAGFIDIVAEAEGDGEVAFEGLPNGGYFARFTAMDATGLEGLPVTYAVERRLNAVGVEAPAAVPGARRQYLFRWRVQGEGASVARFVLGRSEDGTDPIVDIPGLRGDSVVVADLPPGVYHWRVLVTRFDNARRYEKWTPSQRFEIGR